MEKISGIRSQKILVLICMIGVVQTLAYATSVQLIYR